MIYYKDKKTHILKWFIYVHFSPINIRIKISFKRQTYNVVSYVTGCYSKNMQTTHAVEDVVGNWDGRGTFFLEGFF